MLECAVIPRLGEPDGELVVPLFWNIDPEFHIVPDVCAFKDKLAVGDVTVNMHDYGNFEKVGDLGFDLPTNDTQITTQPGDIILYQGNSITVYYDTNSWNFTRLGKIENVSGEQLLSAFGEGDVTITFSLNNPN